MTDEDLKRMDLDFTLTPATEPEKPAGAFKAGEHMVWAAGVRWRVEAVRAVDRHTIEVDLAGDNGRALARRLARDRPVGYALDT